MVQYEQEQNNKRPLEDEEIEMEGTNKRIRTGNETVEVVILVKGNDMGQVIGKGGETIKSIRAESGASIYTSKFLQNVGERTAKLTGTIEQVCTAIRMVIDSVSKEHPSITLLGEYRNLGALIGKQGANIKQLREETGAKIFITKECIGNSTQKEIQISGDYEGVMHAVESVVCKLAEGEAPTRIPYVPGEVGAQGMGLVMASFPSTGGVGSQGISPGTMTQGMGFDDLGVSGTSVCRIETTMWVPKETIGQIIGRGGENIKTVRMQSTAHVNIDAGEDGDETPERKITIKGSVKAIAMACGMIEQLANARK